MQHTLETGTELRLKRIEKAICWRQSVLANERHQLIGRDQKRHRIHKTEQPQNDKPREPVGISESKKLFREALVVNRETLFLSAAKIQRPTLNAQRLILN